MDLAARRWSFFAPQPSRRALAGTPGGDRRPRRTWRWLAAASPGQVALLWAMAAVVSIANWLVFPDEGRLVSSTLFLSGTPIFTGLLAGRVLRLRHTTFHLMGALTSLWLLANLVSFALKFATPAAVHGPVAGIIGLFYLLATGSIIYFGYGAARSRRRRGGAIALALILYLGAAALLNMDIVFWNLSTEVRPLLGRPVAANPADDAAPDIADDTLWGAQPALIEKARAALKPHTPGRTNVYAMAVAGSGTQALFSREAREALRVAARHFGDDSAGGALLSNGAKDMMRSPLATRANIAAVAKAIGEKADHKRDIMFLYLVSHGGQTAELASDLPSYRSVQPISSVSTAQALKGAGVARRVIVVSACYSGTWIPALADDNTIVITAAAKDRTSFGCDDTRNFTVFGEAFLGSLAARNVSLHDAFEDAKRKISVEERKEKETPSLPQVFVGRNMAAFWLGQPGGHPAA